MNVRAHPHARAWSVPGALGPGPEPFDGAAVLDELCGERALLVWQTLRDVHLWIAADVPSGAVLFGRGAGTRRIRQIHASFGDDPVVHDALLEMGAVLKGTARNPQGISAACAALAEWASDSGFPRTAFAAAFLGATASPRDPGSCRLAGVMARRNGDHLRAEAWLRRALSISRRRLDGQNYGLALMGLANLHMLRFEAGPAIRRLRQALKAARRFALWDLRALAYHDLFLVASTHGHPVRAARYALMATRGYGHFHPRLTALAHDVAWFLLLRDRPARALDVLREIDSAPLRPQERLFLLSTTARAAGAALDASTYWRLWSDIWLLLDPVLSYDRTAEALVNLAWGAAGLGDTTRLELAAREALRLAQPRGEREAVEVAGHMLACLAEGRLPQLPVRVVCSDADVADACTAAELLLQRLMQAPALRPRPGG